MKIFWTESAVRELNKIYIYHLEEVNYGKARKVLLGLRDAPKVLSSHPALGQVEEYLIALELDHRYLLHENFKIIYRIKGDCIYITDVFETHQNPDSMILRNI